MIKISFVLPCYNVEHYISDCLDSIFAQKMPKSEYEVICVNDCSTDGTKSIINNYCQKYSNLILINHEQNTMLGGARNTGMLYAHGEYIWHVDPDDLIISNVSEVLFNKAKMADADVFFFNYDIINVEKQHVKTVDMFSNHAAIDGRNYVYKYYRGRLSELTIVWCCLLKRSFVTEYNLSFPLGMRKSADDSFVWDALLRARRVCSTKEKGYLYRINESSVTFMTKKANVAFSERILLGNEIIKMLQTDGASFPTFISEDLVKILHWCANDNIGLLVKMSQEEITKYYSEMKIHNDAVLSVRQFMNRKNKWLYRNNWSAEIWKVKIKILSLLDKWMK